MREKLPLEHRVLKAGHLVVRAHTHVQMYLAFEERTPHLLQALDEFPHLKLDAHAHRVTAIVECWSMLDDTRGKDYISLPRLAAELREESILGASQCQAVCERLRRLAARPKLERLRHNVIAHRSAKITFDDQFKTVGLTPDELNECANEMLVAARALYSAMKLGPLLPVDVRKEYLRLLEVLSHIGPDY